MIIIISLKTALTTCSILEVAKPELNLKDQLPFYVIPSDTIKALLTDPQLVKKYI
ncbi:MAG: hypothetical protein U0T83_11450 [Bacteriovoracaceae bacterium]